MDSSEAEDDYIEDFPAHGRRLPPPVREAAGLILAVILLAVVYYHGRIASLGPRVQLFGWFGINFVVLFGVPALVIKLMWRENLSSYGLRWGKARVWGKYVLFFGLVLLPVLLISSYLPSIRGFYPIYPYAKLEIAARLLAIVGWGVYFFAWEFFFRGFLLNLLSLRYGAFAIIVQMVPFVMMHFPKPEVETFAAIIAGLALGIMCYHGKSFLGAWLLHWGAATLLDQLVIWHGP